MIYSSLLLPAAYVRLFATLHVRWLPNIFNCTTCTACNQNATPWNLPPYRITILLINDVMLISVCLLDDLILGFCYSNLTGETGGFELTWTYHLCIMRKPVNLVCFILATSVAFWVNKQRKEEFILYNDEPPIQIRIYTKFAKKFKFIVVTNSCKDRNLLLKIILKSTINVIKQAFRLSFQ